jgi:hypothetical protein
MKASVFALIVSLGAASAFAPAPLAPQSSTALNAEAEQSRKAFFSVAGAAVLGAAIAAPGIVNAMDQENISTPTEVWETGKPTAVAAGDRKARYETARNQNTSNFPPIKRLTLERKSPVTRLDLNAPDFAGTSITETDLS